MTIKISFADLTHTGQLIAANKILKDHKISEEALVKAILSSEFKRIFSLNHPKAAGIIKNYQLLLDSQSNQKQDIEVKKDAKHQKKKFGKKNILKTLRNLENGEEEI